MLQNSQTSFFVSIIVPTFEEAENLKLLIPRIHANVSSISTQYEIIIVDDNSMDGTIEIIDQLATKFPVSIITRTNEKGLSSAVLCGITIAQFDHLVVMDADLSHRPEELPSLLAPLMNNYADFVVGSRNLEDSSIADNWGVFRHLNTKIASLLAAPLTQISDPMSGFFAFNKQLLENIDYLNPVGYKIGLELLVKTEPERIKEVPIRFEDRHAGESKLTLSQQVLYLKHLKRLYEYRWQLHVQFILFSLVGFLGLSVDSLTMVLLHGVFGVPFHLSRLPSFVIAATANYQLNKMITFVDTPQVVWIHGWIKFIFVSSIGFFSNWIVSVYFYKNFELCNIYYLIPVLVGCIAGAFVNFTLSKLLVFQSRTLPGLPIGTKPYIFGDEIRTSTIREERTNIKKNH